MMQPEFVTLDVFTDRPYGGNPLAVFPEAEGLDAAEMQLIAREFNLSETVFVLPPRDPANTRRLRIFTPATELPFAGHPTVGSAYALAALGLVETSEYVTTEFKLEEEIGVVRVTVQMARRRPVYVELSAAQLPTERAVALERADAAALLSLPPEALDPADVPSIVSCGVPFLFVALNSRSALAAARIDQTRCTLLGRAAVREIYPYYREPGGRTVHGRMFAPALGVLEDPATGSAAAALALRLARLEPTGDALRWTIHQGEELGRASRMELSVERRGTELMSVRVGGTAVLVTRGRLLRPWP